MNKLDAPAYTEVFKAIFSQVKTDYPEFKVGGSLKGIIADWSDTQLLGLTDAVGNKVADVLVKGCQVKSNFILRYLF